MKPITQKHSMGCAVACTAFVAGLKYSEALSLFKNKDNAWLNGYYCNDIIAALAKIDITASFFYIKPHKRKLIYRPHSIVFIKRSKRYPFGHFLVRTHNKQWMNPWINLPIITPAKASFQKRLPGKPIYAIHI